MVPLCVCSIYNIDIFKFLSRLGREKFKYYNISNDTYWKGIIIPFQYVIYNIITPHYGVGYINIENRILELV